MAGRAADGEWVWSTTDERGVPSTHNPHHEPMAYKRGRRRATDPFDTYLHRQEEWVVRRPSSARNTYIGVHAGRRVVITGAKRQDVMYAIARAYGADPGFGAPTRVQPLTDRDRERIEAILASARACMGERGTDL